ncbi:hypothetical protein C8R45DRAFT_1155848 [Mycena sanguinolenta]|nr:hypothetical protein C8R45DRAFT_1155848 [Mycena sanguinolenta]
MPLDLLSHRCCEKAADDATVAHVPRDPGKSHKVAAVSDHHRYRDAAGPNPTVPRTPNRRAPQVSVPPRRQPLAQPIGPLWRNSRQAAEDKQAVVENTKVRRQEMEAREKRTCELVIYHTAGKKPLIVSQYVDTFPRLQLSQSAAVVDAFKLTPTSVLDYWAGSSGWKIIDISYVLTVETERRTILRIRPSLLKELSLDDCIGLADELARQPRAHGTKRGGPEDIVSPLKKTARLNQSIGDASQASHSIIDTLENAPPLLPPTNIPRLEADSPLPLATPASLPPLHSAETRTAATGSKTVRENMWISNLPVTSWITGWEAIKKLQDEDPRFKTEAAAFPQVFGKDYHKGTVCKYKAHWKRIHEDLREKYLAMGEVSAASWGNMLHEAKTYIPDAAASTSCSIPSSLPLPKSNSRSSTPNPPILAPFLLPLPNRLPPAPVPLPESQGLSSVPPENSLAPTTHCTPSDGLYLPSADYFDPQPTPLLDTPLRPKGFLPAFDSNDLMDMNIFNQIIVDHPTPPRHRPSTILPNPTSVPTSAVSTTWPRTIHADLKRRVQSCFVHVELILEDPTASDLFVKAEERREYEPAAPFLCPTG